MRLEGKNPSRRKDFSIFNLFPQEWDYNLDKNEQQTTKGNLDRLPHNSWTQQTEIGLDRFRQEIQETLVPPTQLPPFVFLLDTTQGNTRLQTEFNPTSSTITNRFKSNDKTHKRTETWCNKEKAMRTECLDNKTQQLRIDWGHNYDQKLDATKNTKVRTEIFFFNTRQRKTQRINPRWLNKDKTIDITEDTSTYALKPIDMLLDQRVSRHVARLPKNLARLSNVWFVEPKTKTNDTTWLKVVERRLQRDEYSSG